jgi:hypothetical protein
VQEDDQGECSQEDQDDDLGRARLVPQQGQEQGDRPGQQSPQPGPEEAAVQRFQPFDPPVEAREVPFERPAAEVNSCFQRCISLCGAPRILFIELPIILHSALPSSLL